MNAIQTKAPFKPNCVFIPDSEGNDPDPKVCPLLMLDGDNIQGECFTKEAWEQGGEAFCIRRLGQFESLMGGTIIEGGRVELLPDLWVVKLDEREYWCEEVKSKTKRLMGVYVVDRRRHVHCCSFSPSYELHFLGSQYEPVELSDEEEERLHDDILEGDSSTNDVRYFDCHGIDRTLKNVCREGCLPKGGSGGFRLQGIVAVTTAQAIEEAMEAYRSSEF